MTAKSVFCVLVLMTLIFVISANAQNEKSVSLGGHVFEADLPDGWVLSSEYNNSYKFDSSNPDDAPNGANVIGTWKGENTKAFDFLAYPNAPKDNSNYGEFTGYVIVYILTVPDELKQSLHEKDIAVYGSLDKVPDDRKAQDLQEILLNAAYVIKIGAAKYDSDKAITFSDHDARLFERDDGVSDGIIAISLDPYTVALIHASVKKERLLGQEDAALFDGRAWDIINAITAT
jgi:hypothetical protein